MIDALCSKCDSPFESRQYGGRIRVLRCTGCRGLFADPQTLARLKKEWMSEILDSGDRAVGAENDAIIGVTCPACDVPMESRVDPEQTHLRYEVCPQCNGVYFDAGEFTDWKHEDLLDWFKGLFFSKSDISSKSEEPS